MHKNRRHPCSRSRPRRCGVIDALVDGLKIAKAVETPWSRNRVNAGVALTGNNCRLTSVSVHISLASSTTKPVR